MSIGIIGAGSIGSALATILGRAMIPAVIANSRGPESLKALTGELGPAVTAGTVEQAAAQDIVIVAVPWSKLPGALAGLDLGGKIVIDANNPIEAPLFKPADLRGRVSSAVFAELVPGAGGVKAFTPLPPPLLRADPQGDGGNRVLFYSGDDSDAKTQVARIIDRLGFFGIDLGDLATGGRLAQFPGGPLPALNLVKLG